MTNCLWTVCRIVSVSINRKTLWLLISIMSQMPKKPTNFRVQLEIMISVKTSFDTIYQILELLAMSGVHFKWYIPVCISGDTFERKNKMKLLNEQKCDKIYVSEGYVKKWLQRYASLVWWNEWKSMYHCLEFSVKTQSSSHDFHQIIHGNGVMNVQRKYVTLSARMFVNLIKLCQSVFREQLLERT